MPTDATPIRQGALVFGGDARTNRGFAVLVLAGTAVVIALSFLLTPDAHGYGTHRQLFLMPCWFKVITGIPCPFCGMTTAFAHLSRAQVTAALNCHVLSPLAYALAWTCLVTGLRGVITGQWPLPVFLTSNRFGLVMFVVVLVGWGINVARGLM